MYKWMTAILLSVMGVFLYFFWQKPPPSAPPPIKSDIIKPIVSQPPKSHKTLPQREVSYSIGIKAEINGKLLAIHFTPGEVVQKGQLLFTLDPSAFHQKLAELKKTLSKDQATLMAARKHTEHVEVLLAKHYMTQSEVDQLKAMFLAQQALVQADHAVLHEAERLLSHTKIIGPMMGKTSDLKVMIGDNITTDLTLVIITKVPHPTIP